MLHHTGKYRTYAHNLRLAALLCLTAGFVNGAGFLSFYVLTTNVTGHVALFAEKLAIADFPAAGTVGLWMLLFLGGAMVSSFIIGKVGKEHRFAYTISLCIEIVILLFVAVYGTNMPQSVTNTRLLAGCLLFAMGLQNAMVSMVSGSVVRTTHLTGIFTDLGIDLSALLQINKTEDARLLRQRVFLRLAIIFFFFLGCVTAAYWYPVFKLKEFFIPAAILIVVMFYDIFRFRIHKVVLRLKRR
ncbi:YoaK family protein [Mucilaginibacter auburnensis]|uniref:Uncharacterized membrane protein YoaK (UPF0700 family) n=1 Tax=Mucilaginibacter auburnensis TaxID=1457233 RepID=A0A2H9VNL4_9SPHI|nr:YoaK family protein [Mucilaginibacter auburnensis]PJJ79935.1 uncharacterized membrane protein YoaK (UPF0700 family) [Mucilaginibacter auburnensis]